MWYKQLSWGVLPRKSINNSLQAPCRDHISHHMRTGGEALRLVQNIQNHIDLIQTE